jgi:hypothetical protein
MDETTEQVKKEPVDYNRNPDGKGGFADNPENINPGGRPKNQESFTYWMNHFKNLSVVEFLAWQKNTPEAERSVASDLAYSRVFNARKDLTEFKEVADRTEGRATAKLEHSGEIANAGSDKIAELLQVMYEQTRQDDKTDS